MPPVQPPGHCDIPGKPHGTVKTVPYKPAGNTASSRNIATNKPSRGRGGACPARGFMAITILRVNRRGGIYAARKPPGYCDIPGKPHGTVKTVPYKPAGKLHFPQLLLAFRLFVGRGPDPSLPPSQWYDISENRAPFGAILCAARSQRCGWVKTHPYNTTRKRDFPTNCGTQLCVPYELTRWVVATVKRRGQDPSLHY